MHLQVVTPLGIVIDRDGVDKLNIKSSTGWLEILPGHEDLITPLVPAVFHYTTSMHIYDLVITNGVMNIENKTDSVTIIADATFYKNQIDYKVVTELLENAEKRLKSANNRRSISDIQSEISEQRAKLNLLNYPGKKRI